MIKKRILEIESILCFIFRLDVLWDYACRINNDVETSKFDLFTSLIKQKIYFCFLNHVFGYFLHFKKK